MTDLAETIERVARNEANERPGQDLLVISRTDASKLLAAARRVEAMEAIDPDHYRARIDAAETADCSYMGNKCNSSRCPKHGDIAVEQSVLRILLDLAADRQRLVKLFDDAGQGEHNVLALIDHYQDRASAVRARVRELTEAARAYMSGDHSEEDALILESVLRKATP